MLRAIIVVMLVPAIAPVIARAQIPEKIADIIRAEAERASGYGGGDVFDARLPSPT